MNRDDLRRRKQEENARIRAVALYLVDESPQLLARRVSETLDVPVARVYVQIRALVSDGALCCEGRTAQRRYWLSEQGRKEQADTVPLSRADRELLRRKPRTMHEAERRAWLLRKLEKIAT